MELVTDHTAENLLETSTELGQLRNTNQNRLRTLASQGAQVELGAARLNHILDTLLPPTTQARLDFELAWETGIANQLEGIEAEIRKQQLLAGVNTDVPPLVTKGS